MVKASILDQLLQKLRIIEDILALFIFTAMCVLPVLEPLCRLLNINSIPASQVLVQHLHYGLGC